MPPKVDAQAKAQKKAEQAKKAKARRPHPSLRAQQRCCVERERVSALRRSCYDLGSALTRLLCAAQALEDKTFGLKNKNKSAKVQKCAPRPHRRASRRQRVAAARARPGAPIAAAAELAARSYVETMKKSLESSQKNSARLALLDPNSKEAKAVRALRCSTRRNRLPGPALGVARRRLLLARIGASLPALLCACAALRKSAAKP